jgi:NAD(P)-dependent dehydrogenase (short-subunit alcohol dehydrogenase family)
LTNTNRRRTRWNGARPRFGYTAVKVARRASRIDKKLALALVDISEPGLAETVQLVDGASIRISRHRLDVADRAAVATLPQAVVAEHGRVDPMINNAGVALAGTFDQVSEADFDWLIEINFAAVVRLTRAFLPHLKSSDDARIVNMSSLFGLVSPPGQTAYAASKFAV